MPRVNWFRFNPEVLAVVTGGRLGLKPHIEMNDLRLRTRFFGTTSEAVEASSASMTTILRLFPETIFLLDHDFIELYGNNNSSLATSARAALLGVSARFPSVKWIDVLENQRIPIPKKIPIPTGPNLVAWFNLPLDNHKSDLGVTIYGKAVASFLIAGVEVGERSSERWHHPGATSDRHSVTDGAAVHRRLFDALAIRCRILRSGVSNSMQSPRSVCRFSSH